MQGIGAGHHLARRVGPRGARIERGGLDGLGGGGQYVRHVSWGGLSLLSNVRVPRWRNEGRQQKGAERTFKTSKIL